MNMFVKTRLASATFKFVMPRKFSALINKGLHLNLMPSKDHLKVDSSKLRALTRLGKCD